MLNLDRVEVEKIIFQMMESYNVIQPYNFCVEDGKLVLLGQGASSYVYEIYDMQSEDKRYAAKILGLSIKNTDEELIKAIVKAQYLLGEQSENITRVIGIQCIKLQLDNGRLEDVIFSSDERYDEIEGAPVQIVLMERLDSLLSIDKFGKVNLLRKELNSEAEVIRLANNIGSSLKIVHDNEFLHRDIKLDNIFWDEDTGRYKLGDFGVARYIGNGGAETVIFTDGYGAPEIERRLVSSYNVTADIYSFGITMFLLLNNLKFPASNDYTVNLVQYSKDFIIPAPSNASEKLVRIIRKMCHYSASERYQTIDEVLVDIEKINVDDSAEKCVDIDNLLTETYHDDKGEATKVDCINRKKEWWEKEFEEFDREDMKTYLKVVKKEYTVASIISALVFAVLVAFLFKAISPNATYCCSITFAIMPIALFIEAIFQKIKDFSIVFGSITIGLAIFSMCSTGVDVPQILTIIIVLIGVPAITAGTAIGVGMWMFQMITGEMEWLKVLSQWNLSWIIIIGLITVAYSYFLKRFEYKEKMEIGTYSFLWLVSKSGILLIVVGIITFVLDWFGTFAIPDIVKNMHLTGIGLGILVIERIFLARYNLLDCDEV